MNIINSPLNDKKWISSAVNKTHIVWHGSFNKTKYTNGRATSTIDRWNNLAEKYATAYIIDRDGTVFNTFPADEWAYHLNIPTSGAQYDKHSVGITFANEQQLIKVGSRYFAFEYEHITNLYSGPVVECEWRNRKYWARLDQQQIDTGIELSLELCKRFQLEPIFYCGVNWTPDIWKRATIFPHSAVKREVTDLLIEDWVIDKIKQSGIKVIDS